MVKYNQSIIYKLCCKDPSITDIYIGSTTRFARRKSQHKSICNNTDTNNQSYNFYVYQFIRENNGFSNWDMIEIEKYEDWGDLDSWKIIQQKYKTIFYEKIILFNSLIFRGDYHSLALN